MGLLSGAMLALFAAEIAKNFLMSRKRVGVERAQVEAMGKQAQMQSAMGRREEKRTDELMNRLAQRAKSSELHEDIRSAEDRQTQMAMAMMMALSNMKNNMGQVPGPGGPSASMLSYLR